MPAGAVLARRTAVLITEAAVRQDLMRAARTLRRAPAFSIVALCCVALGIAVTTTIFGAVHGILLRALPFPDADALVAVRARAVARDVRAARVSWNEYVAWRDESRVFESFGLWTARFDELAGVEDAPERVAAALVTVDVLPMLGLAPVLGRTFTPEEEQPGADRVVVLGHGLWQRRYGADPGIIGRVVRVGGQPHTVVGVLPPGAGFPEGVQLWRPLAFDPARDDPAARLYDGALGRLSTGEPPGRARADLAAISSRLAFERPQDYEGWTPDVVPLREHLVGDLVRPLLVFLGAALLVLVIAAANVANLTLARGLTRHRQIAIRVALGAGRRSILRTVLAESLVLGVVGGGLGLLLAIWGVRFLTLAFPDGVPSTIALIVDPVVVLFALATSILTALAFGIGPALRATRVSPEAALRQGEGRVSEGPVWRRVRGGLVAAEIALSLVLMIAASLLIRSDLTLERELGFDPEGVLSLRVPLPAPQYEGPRRELFYEELFARIRALPGVSDVGSSAVGAPMSTAVPLARRSITLEGETSEAARDVRVAVVHEITPEYLEAMRVPLLAGRGFSPADRDTAVRAAIVNATFARTFFPTGEAVGRRITWHDRDAGIAETVTIVGVSDDFRQERPPSAIVPAVYLYRPFDMASQTLAIRTTLADPVALAPTVRGILREMDATLPVYLIEPLGATTARGLWRQRLQAQVLGVFAALALLLATFGIYGVISYAVAEQTRELGVRVALGATRTDVLSLVLGQGARLALIGVITGLIGALAVGRLLSGLLYGVAAGDPLTYLAMPAVLGAVALLAAIMPARRAAGVDPISALRTP
jgi:putative ABC transport system permease protein